MSARLRSGLVWREVRASDVQVGDCYANVATVTEVVRGPRAATDRTSFGHVVRGDVALYCGDSFATKGKASRWVIVGRLA